MSGKEGDCGCGGKGSAALAVTADALFFQGAMAMQAAIMKTLLQSDPRSSPHDVMRVVINVPAPRLTPRVQTVIETPERGAVPRETPEAPE